MYLRPPWPPSGWEPLRACAALDSPLQGDTERLRVPGGPARELTGVEGLTRPEGFTAARRWVRAACMLAVERVMKRGMRKRRAGGRGAGFSMTESPSPPGSSRGRVETCLHDRDSLVSARAIGQDWVRSRGDRSARPRAAASLPPAEPSQLGPI